MPLILSYSSASISFLRKSIQSNTTQYEKHKNIRNHIVPSENPDNDENFRI